ncbi:tyrosine-type recombinase/integrase [uncultured Acetobacteroides sp.]|uniref:tyrosine-type recombinase/integrase n=1 Tax=uncultured Acetobacteroides sp. TaxID=1760811 RepID=UPI0029F48BB2|nr:tyrosine-type recombinase/integrase [uncultured Acetobacteroides sp.]
MITQFEQYLLAEKRYSPHTVKAYKTDLLQFVDFLGYTPENFLPSDVTSQLVRGWVVNLVKSRLASCSVNRKIASVNTFYIYLKRSGVVSKNPAAKVMHPKEPKRLPAFVGYDAIEQIARNEGSDFVSFRNLLIVELLYTCGIRRAELVGIKVDDVDGQTLTLRVFGKGKKERIIPLIPSTNSLLKCYISQREEFFSERPTPYLFLTAKGEQIYPKLVERVVKEMLKNAGVNGKRSPHVLRHTFATHLLDNGADLLSIKEMLGHSSLGTTQIYTHNTLEKIKTSYMKAHPRVHKNS